MLINHTQARCSTCYWWEAEDHKAETCKGTYGTKPGFCCPHYTAKKAFALCGECRWLNEPMRNKTCANNFDRSKTTPICDPPISRNRRYERLPALTQVDLSNPYMRDGVTGFPLDVLECDPSRAAVLLVPEDGHRYGLLIAVQHDGARIQPVQIINGSITTTGSRRRFDQMAFSGEVFAVDWDGDPHLIEGEIGTLNIRFEDPEKVWRQASSNEVDSKVKRRGSLGSDLVQIDEPELDLPTEKAYILGPAMMVARDMALAGKIRDPQVISERVARRFATSHNLAESERDQLQAKLYSTLIRE